MNPLESLMDPLFDEVSDGICASDAEGNILYMNPAAERMLETPFFQTRGRTLCELLCGHLATPRSRECASACPLRGSDSAEKAVTFKGRHNQRISYEWGDVGLKCVDKWRNLRVRCLRTPSNSQGIGGRFTVIEDVSAEMELERQKEDWRNMVAHDLRNPLAMIYAALRELQEVTAKITAHSRAELIELGVRNCKRMAKLLDLYLDVAKLDAGLMKVQISRLALAETVRACVEEQGPLTREKRIEVTVDVPMTLAVLADADLLPRVVQNLLDNAVKFTPVGGRIAIRAVPEAQDAVLLSFEDTGPGISPTDLPKLFDRYHQAEAGRQGKIKGTGLGLAFCREALKAMKGDIQVESTPGSGSSFTIRLPMDREHDRLEPGPVKAPGRLA